MSDSMIKIRQATSADLKLMCILLKELFSIETDFSYNETKQKAGIKRLLNEPKALLLVAECNTLIVGMCTVQMVISTAEGNYVGLLEDMVVHDKFRGQGIGKALISAAEEWARAHKLPRLKLLADMRNENAHKFYVSLGWEQTNMVCWRKHLPK